MKEELWQKNNMIVFVKYFIIKKKIFFLLKCFININVNINVGM